MEDEVAAIKLEYEKDLDIYRVVLKEELKGLTAALEELINETTNRRFSMFSKGLEDRLADAMTKALDIVTADFKERIQDLEEDQARILRHLGLKA